MITATLYVESLVFNSDSADLRALRKSFHSFVGLDDLELSIDSSRAASDALADLDFDTDRSRLSRDSYPTDSKVLDNLEFDTISKHGC